MGRKRARRVRWGNIGRLAGVVLLVGLVAAWPRLGPPEIRLPPRDASPFGAAAPKARDDRARA
jgi:hypothetical protein